MRIDSGVARPCCVDFDRSPYVIATAPRLWLIGRRVEIDELIALTFRIADCWHASANTRRVVGRVVQASCATLPAHSSLARVALSISFRLHEACSI